jgi:anti-sigma-K factor RskA
MSRNHIIGLIEGSPLATLSESELEMVRTHTNKCAECRQAFKAARISMLLLKNGAPETFEPSPFFHTRVLARLRERQVSGDLWSWSKVWRAAGALASSMVATVAALAALTFIIPAGPGSSASPDMTTALNTYSAEEVLLDQSEAVNDQVSEDQILNTLYGSDDEAAR